MILCTKFQVSSTKNFAQLKKVRPQTKESEELKKRVLDDFGHLFNELYYIYKDK